VIARLVESQTIAPDIRQFLFETPEVETLEYRPGQFVSFTESVAGRNITRAYSLASAPCGNRFELCLNRVQDGALSPYLFQLQPGACVPMTGPLGYFVPREPFRDALFVATGTGLAPFRSYLQHPSIGGGTAAITLLFGTRHECGLLYRAEWERLAAARPGFLFLPTLTRPEPGWQGRAGRVQAHLDEALAGRTDVDVYICGLRAMVDDVRSILKARGFDRQRLIYEKYD
jgi:ferredoxin-NADP reductase